MKQQNVEYYDNAINWYFNNNCHRDWYCDNYHRDGDLPDEYNFENGKLISVTYCQHGKFHRTTGPATIDYKCKIKEYYYQDRYYDSLEHMMMVEVCM